MLVTSGFNFEGYRITRYLGFFSGETALIGVFSEDFAGAAESFGTTSTKFADKLGMAKNYAITELEKRRREPERTRSLVWTWIIICSCPI